MSVPLPYLAGICAEAGGGAPRVLVDGYFGGSLSMTSWALDAPCPEVTGGAGAAGVPDPSVVPPEETNI